MEDAKSRKEIRSELVQTVAESHRQTQSSTRDAIDAGNRASLQALGQGVDGGVELFPGELPHGRRMP